MSPKRPLSAHNPVFEPKDADPGKQEPMKTDIRQFARTGFSNTQTQQDIVQNSNSNAARPSIQPDPAGIDGDQPPVDQDVAGRRPEQPVPQSATGAQMAEELDGLNKYLAGVRVPGAIKAQSAYTLANMRQDEQAHRINQLYRAGPRATAGL